MGYILAVPPATAQEGDWHSVGESLLQSITEGEIDPVVKMYAQLGDAYRAGNPAAFNQHVDSLAGWLAKEQPTATKRAIVRISLQPGRSVHPQHGSLRAGVSARLRLVVGLESDR